MGEIRMSKVYCIIKDGRAEMISALKSKCIDSFSTTIRHFKKLLKTHFLWIICSSARYFQIVDQLIGL